MESCSGDTESPTCLRVCYIKLTSHFWDHTSGLKHFFFFVESHRENILLSGKKEHAEGPSIGYLSMELLSGELPGSRGGPLNLLVPWSCRRNPKPRKGNETAGTPGGSREKDGLSACMWQLAIRELPCLSLQPHPSPPSWSTGSPVLIPRGTLCFISLCQVWLIVSHSPWCHSRDIPGYPLRTQIFPRVSIFSSNPDGPGALSTPL